MLSMLKIIYDTLSKHRPPVLHDRKRQEIVV